MNPWSLWSQSYQKSTKMGFENKFRKKTYCMGCGAEIKDLVQEDQKNCIRECEDFKYLGVKIYKEAREENDSKNRVNNGTTITAMLYTVLWNRQITRKKLLTCKSIVKSTFTYGAEIWKFSKNLESKLI